MDRLLGEKGNPKDSAAGRQEFGQLMERRRQEEAATDHRAIRRGWSHYGVASRGGNTIAKGGRSSRCTQTHPTLKNFGVSDAWQN